jgi:hypothetical protein
VNAVTQTYTRPAFKVMHLPLYWAGVDRRFVALAFMAGAMVLRFTAGSGFGVVRSLLLGFATAGAVYGLGWYTRNDPVWLPLMWRRLAGKLLGHDHARYDALHHRVFKVGLR